MATSKMIDIAAGGDRKPIVGDLHQGSTAVLHQPHMAVEEEVAERGRAARTLLRITLGFHDCPSVAACDKHGQAVCGCHPCADPRHADDAVLLEEALLAFGLKREERKRICSTCHRVKAQSRFRAANETCTACLDKRTPAAT